jgi:succinoglycan biosynthesis transport protein ExoP
MIRMRQAQIRLHELLGMYRRRWKLVVIPTVIVSIVCTTGAFLLPRKYEATTTMLVRPDQTLRAIGDFQELGGYEEQLRSYGDIIFSRTFIQAVIDSLGIGRGIQTEAEKEALIRSVRSSIGADRRGPDSFSITFASSDPGTAKRGAEVVADLFIQTKLRLENRQIFLTIQFLENKVEELRGEFEKSARSLVFSMQENSDELPMETRTLYTQITGIEAKISTTNERLKTSQKNLLSLRALPELLRSNPEGMRSESGKLPLLELMREDLPFVGELQTLVTKYDDLTRKYTGKWPEIEKLEIQIATLLDRIRGATETEVARLQTQGSDLERQRGAVIEEIKKSSLSERMNQDKQSSYEVDLRQYNDMKSRLEQARLKAEVESKGANQYIVLDPPIYPTSPTKPNRRMLILAGFGLGFFLGIISVIIAELFDTTIRTSKDIEVYEKPIIALLPDGSRGYR